MKHFLFLYTELAGYFLSCIHALAENGHQILVVHWPINSEAPFKIEKLKNVRFVQKNNENKKEIKNIVSSFNPSLIYVSGWVDKEYKSIAKTYRKNIPVIMALDNPWGGSIRQHLAVLMSRVLIKRFFNKAWGTGYAQYEYARRLGFQEKDILVNGYSADVDLFHTAANSSKMSKSKTILYVGRLLDWKGVGDLYHAFQSIKQKNGWKLLIVGNGPLKEELKESTDINILKFQQPTELIEITKSVTAFCCPSWQENWGVVVHEFAAAGKPLIVSDKVHAAKFFLKNGYNGYTFEAGNVKSLKTSLENLMNSDEKKIEEMGRNSFYLSHQITPKIWCTTIESVLI